MENTKRFYWISKTYGGQEYIFINQYYNVVVTGNTASCKNSMFTMEDEKVKRLKDLKEIKERYINSDYKIIHNKDLSYKALAILNNSNIDVNISLDDLLNMVD